MAASRPAGSPRSPGEATVLGQQDRDLHLPVVLGQVRLEPAPADRFPSGRRQVEEIERIAAASAAGSVGSTNDATAGRTDDPGHPGQVARDTGTPAAIASKSLFGVVSRWLSVVGWIGMATMSADATHSSSSDGGTAGRTCSRPASPGSAALPPGTPATGRSQAAPARPLARSEAPRSAARSRDPARSRPGTGRRASPDRVRGGRGSDAGGSPPVRAGRRSSARRAAAGTPKRAAITSAYGSVDRHHPGRLPGPASLDPREQASGGAGQPGQVGRVDVDIAGVVDDRRPIAPAEVEADRDAHVGHGVDQVGRGRRPVGRRGVARERSGRSPASRRPAPTGGAGGRPCLARPGGRPPTVRWPPGRPLKLDAAGGCAGAGRPAAVDTGRGRSGSRPGGLLGGRQARAGRADDRHGVAAPRSACSRSGTSASRTRRSTGRTRTQRWADDRSASAHARSSPSVPANEAGSATRRALGLPVPAIVGRREAASPQGRPVGRGQVEDRARSPAAIDAGLAGSQAAPSGPAGSSRTIRRIAGKSLATTGTPAARHSKSLLGVDRRWLSGRRLDRHPPTSAPASHRGARPAGPRRGGAAGRRSGARGPALEGRARSGPSRGRTTWSRLEAGLEHRRGQLVDAPVPDERAVVDHDGRRGVPPGGRSACAAVGGGVQRGGQLRTTTTRRGR